MKKSLSLLLILCMVLGLLVGCEKDKDKNASSKPAIVKGSMKEMVEAMSKVKAGTARLEMDLAGTMTMTVDLTFDMNRDRYSFGFGYTVKNTYSGVDTKVEVGELLRFVGNDVYINLDTAAVSEMLADEMLGDKDAAKDMKFGWFKIPLPDDLPKSTPDVSAFVNKFTERFESAIKSASVREEAEGNCSYTFETGEDYKNLMLALREFADQDLQDLLKDAVSKQPSLENIDAKAYLNKLLDCYEDDVRAVCREYGDKIEITESQLDMVLKELEKQDIQSIWKQYVVGELEGEFVDDEKIERLVDDLIEEIDRGLRKSNSSDEPKTKTTIRVEADNEGYTFGLRAVMKSNYSDEEQEIKATLRLIPESVSVSAPSGTNGLKELADIIIPMASEYVDRSRMSTDISVLADLLAATEKIAVDPQFDLAAGTELIVSIEDNEVDFTIEKSGAIASNLQEAIEEWKWISYFNSFYTDSMKKSQAVFVGTLQMNGDVVWTLRSANSEFSKLFSSDTFRDFRVKYNIEP